MLEGRTALVTGASSGFGRRFCECLASWGAHVIATARRRERLSELVGEIADAGGSAEAQQLDVADVESVFALVDRVHESGRVIDVLVANAGVAVGKPLIETSEHDLDHLYEVNVRGAFASARAVAIKMAERASDGPISYGRIVVTASNSGLRTEPMLGAYAMSKAAVVMMTKAMALEWAHNGICVNAICPGMIETEMSAPYLVGEVRETLLRSYPRQRVGRPQHLDTTLRYLVDPSSDFVNGATITVDDGQLIP